MMKGMHFDEVRFSENLHTKSHGIDATLIHIGLVRKYVADFVQCAADTSFTPPKTHPLVIREAYPRGVASRIEPCFTYSPKTLLLS